MRNKLSVAGLLVFCSVLLTSCEAIGDIFKAGIYIGVILVVLVVVLVLWLIRKIRK